MHGMIEPVAARTRQSSAPKNPNAIVSSGADPPRCKAPNKAPVMTAAAYGRIVSVGSTTGAVNAMPGQSGYTAAKAALRAIFQRASFLDYQGAAAELAVVQSRDSGIGSSVVVKSAELVGAAAALEQARADTIEVPPRSGQ